MGLFDKKAADEEDMSNDMETGSVTEQEDTDDNGISSDGELTEGQKKAARYRAALETVIKFAVDNKAPEDVIAACKTIRPSYFGISGGGGGGFAKAEFTADQRRLAQLCDIDNIDSVEVGMEFNEMDAFTKLRMGRREMHILSNVLIKFPGEKPRIWVDFNSDSGVYTVVGVGPDAPKGWTGYLPKDMEA